MKEFSSEIGQQYDSYTFGYAQYATPESGEALAPLYEKGYLPYSGSPDFKDVFYRARSARIPLAGFAFDSENRRIAKKFDGAFEKERIPAAAFAVDDAFRAFCLQYFSALHGERAMPRERLAHILSCGLVTSVSAYRKDGAPVAYALEVESGAMAHYWFSFYDLAYARQSVGMWLMLDHARDAQARGLSHYYLGTVYGEKALYKTNFSPLEWWDGAEWSADTAALKQRARQDAGRVLAEADLWKSGQRRF